MRVRKPRTSFSLMKAPSTETASAWSWVKSTTASRRPTTKTSRSSGERAMLPGTNGAMTLGSGREPITLSTAILRGRGASSASGLASRLRRNSRAMNGQHGRASRSSRRTTMMSVYVPLLVAIVLRSSATGRLERARDRRRGAGALERHPHRQQHRQRAEGRRGRPGLRGHRADGERREHPSDCDPGVRAPRPRAKPEELRAATVIFGGREQTEGSEKPAANLQVPAVVVAAATDRRTGSVEVRFQVTQSLVEILPTLAPYRGRPRERRREPGRSALSPRGKARLEPSLKARQRLGEVEKGRKEAELHPRTRAGLKRKRRPRRAEAGVDQRRQRRDRERHQREQQRVPERAEEREGAESNDHEHPLRRARKRPEGARRRLVERLKRCGAPRAVIDPATAQQLRKTWAVYAAGPAHVAGAVVFPRPLSLEHRLRAAVATLLFPVRAHRPPRVVPNRGRCAESERAFPLPQAPAHVAVAAGGAEPCIESSDRLEAVLAERHVAARDVFSFTIAEQDMNGAARGARDAFGYPTVARRRDVRSTDADMRRAQKPVREIRQPVRIGVRVIVDVRDDLAPGCMKAGVPRAGEAAILGLDQPAVVSARDSGGGVRRAVIHDDDLVVGIGQPLQCLEAIADRAGAVIRADDHGDPGPGEVRRERDLTERVSYGRECRLRRPVGASEAEPPVLDVVRVPVPLVGSAPQPARYRGRDLVAECVAQERWVSGALSDLHADEHLDLGQRLLSVDEKAEILLRG